MIEYSRLGLVRAMLMCADILLLDEPTGASRFVKMLMTSAVGLWGLGMTCHIQICCADSRTPGCCKCELVGRLLAAWIAAVGLSFFMSFSPWLVASQFRVGKQYCWRCWIWIKVVVVPVRIFGKLSSCWTNDVCRSSILDQMNVIIGLPLVCVVGTFPFS